MEPTQPTTPPVTPLPQTPPPTLPTNGKNKVILPIIGLVILVAIIASVGIYYSQNMQGKTPTPTSAPQSQPEIDTIPGVVSKIDSQNIEITNNNEAKTYQLASDVKVVRLKAPTASSSAQPSSSDSAEPQIVLPDFIKISDVKVGSSVSLVVNLETSQVIALTVLK